ncbi:MAG: hypothetical protein KJ069_04145 [Anaerolineae bacterium]|nr:hypothetical protein [Anaerolineae bacterium]
MNRRQFLTMVTAVSAVGLARLSTPHLTFAKGLTPALRQTLYRGTRDGKLYESTDGGKSWQLVANFGTHCTVDQIVTRRGGIYVHIICSGYSFDLHSTDARVWRTA